MPVPCRFDFVLRRQPCLQVNEGEETRPSRVLCIGVARWALEKEKKGEAISFNLLPKMTKYR